MSTGVGVSGTGKDPLANVWAVIEARHVTPLVIVVTRATEADDSLGLGRGLAQVAHAAGRRTGFFGLGSERRSDAVAARYAELSLPSGAATHDGFTEALVVWRSVYDVIVVDAGVLGSEALGLYVVPKATTVVVAVCDQRRVVPADGQLVALLAGLQASVFGVVMTAPIPKSSGALGVRDPARFAAAARVS